MCAYFTSRRARARRSSRTRSSASSKVAARGTTPPSKLSRSPKRRSSRAWDASRATRWGREARRQLFAVVHPATARNPSRSSNARTIPAFFGVARTYRGLDGAQIKQGGRRLDRRGVGALCWVRVTLEGRRLRRRPCGGEDAGWIALKPYGRRVELVRSCSERDPDPRTERARPWRPHREWAERFSSERDLGVECGERRGFRQSPRHLTPHVLQCFRCRRLRTSPFLDRLCGYTLANVGVLRLVGLPTP